MMEAWKRVLGEPPFNAVRLVHKLKVTRDTGFRQVSLDEFVGNVSALHGGAIAPLDDSTRFAWTAAWSLLRWTNCASLASLGPPPPDSIFALSLPLALDTGPMPPRTVAQFAQAAYELHGRRPSVPLPPGWEIPHALLGWCERAHVCRFMSARMQA
jgi:hypothetical protein